MNQQKSVLITGAAGRVASRVIPFLRDTHSLKLTDLHPGQIAGLEIEPTDLMNFDAVLETFKGSSAIVHMAIADYTNAGESAPQEILADYRLRMLDVNIRGTYHVFEAARLLKIPRVVYISSLTVAMGNPEGRLLQFSPTLPPHPSNFYACTKLFGEYVARVYQETYGIQSYVLRMGQPHPLGHDPVKEKERIKDPRAWSVMVSYPDIAHAVSAALLTSTPDFGIYNVISPNRTPYTVDCANGAEIGFTPQHPIGFEDSDNPAVH